MTEALIAALIELLPLLAAGVALLVLLYWLVGKWGDWEADKAQKKMDDEMREIMLPKAEREAIMQRARDAQK